MTKQMLALACLAMACSANANSLTAEGTNFAPAHGYTFRGDRDLVPDGDFEQGTCVNTPTWTCTTDGSCDWIADLTPLGLWNYNGSHVAWLGGFCGGLATCSTTICKDIYFGQGDRVISWYWMAYVNDAVMQFFITVDGNPVYEFHPQPSDHLMDYQFGRCELPPDVVGVRELCLGMDNPGCTANLGDNYFADWVDLWDLTSSADISFSTVKTLY